jgi:hypothetical protein
VAAGEITNDFDPQWVFWRRAARVGYAGAERRALEGHKGAEWLERYHATKWLSDDKNNVVVRDDDAHWGDTVWAPSVIAAGFKYWAIVLPMSAVGQLNMQRFAEEYRQRGVTVGTFDTVEAADRWLKAQG